MGIFELNDILIMVQNIILMETIGKKKMLKFLKKIYGKKYLKL